MENSAVSKAKKRYEALFSTIESKADAFDKLAEKYYFANFGTSSKTDLDTLMFSIYIEKILDVSEKDMATYSDYTLSKLLGITQSKVSSLKVKKELQYPYKDFVWEESFARIVENFRYEGGKIKLYIPDKNLYNEIKNVIEEAGGYVEVQLNTKLLQIGPEYFVDLLVAISPVENREDIKKQLKKALKSHSVSTDEFDRKSIGDLLRGNTSEIITDIAADLIGDYIPFVGDYLGKALKSVVNEIRKRRPEE